MEWRLGFSPDIAIVLVWNLDNLRLKDFLSKQYFGFNGIYNLRVALYRVFQTVKEVNELFKSTSRSMLMFAASFLGLFVLMTTPLYALEAFKVSNHSVTNIKGHQIWFEAEDFTSRSPATDQHWAVETLNNAYGGTVLGPTGAFGGMLRYEFDIRMSGPNAKGGTWYMWARLVNPRNSSDYMLVEGHPGDTIPAQAPPDRGSFNNSQRVFEFNVGQSPDTFGWETRLDEGHTKTLQDGKNVMVLLRREANLANKMDVIMWTDDAGYVPTDQDYENAATLPRIASTYPADGAVDVPVDILGRSGLGISVTFDRIMDLASVKDSKLILTDLTVNSTPFVFDLGVDSANFLDVAFNSDNTTVTVKLSDSVTTTTDGYKDFVQLSEGHRYQVKLDSTSAKDVNGRSLLLYPEDKTFTFATQVSGVAATPTIVSTYPADGATVPVDILSTTGVSLTFSMLMDYDSVKNTQLELSGSTADGNSWVHNLDLNSSDVNLAFSDTLTQTTVIAKRDGFSLLEGQSYQIKLNSTGAHKRGDSSRQLSYTTSDAVFVFQTALQPRIFSTNPAEGAWSIPVDVLRTSGVQLTFTRKMDLISISNSRLTLSDLTAGRAPLTFGYLRIWMTFSCWRSLLHSLPLCS